MSENSKKRAVSQLLADISIIFVLVIIDQLSKYFAISRNWPISFNQGISYGINLPDNLETYLAVVLLFLLSLLYFLVKKSTDKLTVILILAGGFSNFIDRLDKGMVVDIFNLPKLFFFNFADLYITIGVFLFLFVQLKKILPK